MGSQNLDGEIKLKPYYDYIIGLEDKYHGTEKGQINGCVFGYRIVIKNEKYGIIERNLKEIIPCEYKNIIAYEDVNYMHTTIVYFIIQNFENKYSLYIPETDHLREFIWDKVYVEFLYNFIVFKQGDKYGIIKNLNQEFFLNFPVDIETVTFDSGKYFQIKNSKINKYAVFDKNLKQLTKFCFKFLVNFHEHNKVRIFDNTENNYDKLILKEKDFFEKF